MGSRRPRNRRRKRWPGNADAETTAFGRLTRSQLMSRIGSTDNKSTEWRLAGLLRNHKVSGWRRHVELPGRPDFAWPREKVAVFVDGCFWHGHDCNRNLRPKTNRAAWADKIARNRSRDRRVSRELRARGWSVVRIWECQMAVNPTRSLRRIQRTLQKRSLLASAL